jgi:flagellar protein FliS
MKPSLDAAELVQPVQLPEHLVVLLLEGGQRFLAKAEDAIRHQDEGSRDYFLKKAGAILKELTSRLNHKEGGDLVNNLVRLYGWWSQEIREAGAKAEADRLKRVSAQMGEIRRAWEHVLFQGEGMSESPEL